MAMSVVYTTVNGRILRENRGGVVHNFIPDPLGSVVMVRDTAGNTVYEAEYAPYGDVQSETGTNPSEFGYVGTLGYVKDSASSLYVRARYLLTNLGRWLTKDPLWPSEPGYVYAGAAPSSLIDPTGLVAWVPIACAVACGGCLVCLGSLIYNCSDCGMDISCWGRCMRDVIANLPPWAQALCGAACVGCGVCLAVAARGIQPPVPRWQPGGPGTKPPSLPGPGQPPSLPGPGQPPSLPGPGQPPSLPGPGQPLCPPTSRRSLFCAALGVSICFAGSFFLPPEVGTEFYSQCFDNIYNLCMGAPA